MPRGANEAFSRVLIDKALESSGWNLLDSRRVRFELSAVTGRADYLLSDERGPFCVLEAMREETDPYRAKEQARGYAENCRAPFIVLSNGREHWFWNHPLSPQNEFAQRLADMREMEAVQAASPRRLDDLFQSMLHRAFCVGVP